MNILVLDCSSICHRNWHVISDPKMKKTSAISGFLRDIRSLQDIHQTDLTVFCFDSDTSRRKTIYPEYKANHTREGKECLYRQIDLLRKEILPMMGFCNILHCEGFEADDLIARVVQDTDKLRFTIVSSDNDLYQLLTKNKVSIWNLALKRLITYSIFKTEYGVDPAIWPNIKALMGDEGDNIKGIEGIGPKTAIQYFKDPREITERKIRRIESSTDLIRLNEKLITLPWPGLPYLPISDDDHVQKFVWDRVVHQYGVKWLVGKYPAEAL